MKKKSKNKKEKILNKMIIAIYLNIGNLDENDVPGYVDTIMNRLKLTKKYKDLEVFFIPTRGHKKSNIEILYIPNKK